MLTDILMMGKKIYRPFPLDRTKMLPVRNCRLLIWRLLLVSCGLGLILNATYFYYERTRDKFDSQNYAVIEAIIKQKGQEYKKSCSMESRLEVERAWARPQRPGPNFWLAANEPQVQSSTPLILREAGIRLEVNSGWLRPVWARYSKLELGSC